jgi:hypothetical protein
MLEDKKMYRSTLSVLDNKFERLAGLLNGSITKDADKGMMGPVGYEERSIRWYNNGMNNLIQIYPEIKNASIHKWVFWACSSYDHNNNRYWKKKTIMENRKLEKIISQFDRLSIDAIDFINSLKKEDLEMVGKINKI